MWPLINSLIDWTEHIPQSSFFLKQIVKKTCDIPTFFSLHKILLFFLHKILDLKKHTYRNSNALRLLYYNRMCDSIQKHMNSIINMIGFLNRIKHKHIVMPLGKVFPLRKHLKNKYYFRGVPHYMRSFICDFGCIRLRIVFFKEPILKFIVILGLFIFKFIICKPNFLVPLSLAYNEVYLNLIIISKFCYCDYSLKPFYFCPNSGWNMDSSLNILCRIKNLSFPYVLWSDIPKAFFPF